VDFRKGQGSPGCESGGAVACGNPHPLGPPLALPGKTGEGDFRKVQMPLSWLLDVGGRPRVAAPTIRFVTGRPRGLPLPWGYRIGLRVPRCGPR